MERFNLHLWYFLLGVAALLLGSVDFMLGYLFWFFCAVILVVSELDSLRAKR